MKPNRIESCLPDPQQELLLRAALENVDTAKVAWKRWTESVRFADIDGASYRLLPFVYSNLKWELEGDDLIRRIKGVYRHTWFKNQLLMQNALKLIRCFDAKGLPIMLLKGSGLLLMYYKDYGIRSMNDVDLMVPVEYAETGIRLLQENGYSPRAALLPFSSRHIPLIHAYDFANSIDVGIDLHWHVMDECRREESDQDFWNDSIALNFCGVPVRVLHPADQLFHVIVHGMHWDVVRPLRWIVDAMTILRFANPFDWQRFVFQCKTRSLTLPVLDALQYLQLAFDAPIPATVIPELRTLPVSWMQRVEYGFKMRDHTNSFWGYLPLLWFSYCRSAEERAWYKRAIGFANHLKGFWGAKSWWQVPPFALARLLRRMRLVASGARTF